MRVNSTSPNPASTLNMAMAGWVKRYSLWPISICAAMITAAMARRIGMRRAPSSAKARNGTAQAPQLSP